MTDQIHTKYLDRYKGVNAEIPQICQFNKSTYIGKATMTKRDTMKRQDQFHLQISLQQQEHY